MRKGSKLILSSKVAITLLLIFNVFESNATVQIPENLVINQDTLIIRDYPLMNLLKKDTNLLKRGFGAPDNSVFFSPCLSSACWRGYLGTWEIRNDSLFLIDISSCCSTEQENNQFSMKKAFGKRFNNGVFASWVTEQLHELCIMLPCKETLQRFKIIGGIWHPSNSNSSNLEDNLKGAWGVYATEKNGMSTHCNICPRFQFEPFGNAVIYYPDNSTEMYKWVVLEDTLNLIPYFSKREKFYFDARIYHLQINRKESFTELLLLQSNGKKIILRK